MDKKKLRQCAEGLIVTAAGLGYVLLSLGIRRNPVKTDGFWGLLTEAKYLPLLLSAMLTLQGVRLTAALWKGQEVSAGGHSITKRSVSVVLLTLAYLLLISKVGFTLPTAAYLTAILFLLNRGRRPLELLLLSGVYCLAALLLIPGVLGLQLL